MQEYDVVELVAEREEYAKEGVHKGMIGWILDPRKLGGDWLVNFEQDINPFDIAMIPVKEYDLVAIREKIIIKPNERVVMISNGYDEKEGIKFGTDGFVVSYDKEKESYTVDFNVKNSEEPVRVVTKDGDITKYCWLSDESKKSFGLED